LYCCMTEKFDRRIGYCAGLTVPGGSSTSTIWCPVAVGSINDRSFGCDNPASCSEGPPTLSFPLESRLTVAELEISDGASAEYKELPSLSARYGFLSFGILSSSCPVCTNVRARYRWGSTSFPSLYRIYSWYVGANCNQS
jgi:hypothetical protein